MRIRLRAIALVFVLLGLLTACESDDKKLDRLQTEEMNASLLVQSRQRRLDSLVGERGFLDFEPPNESRRAELSAAIAAAYDSLSREERRLLFIRRDLNRLLR